jgi:hypothetical protein
MLNSSQTLDLAILVRVQVSQPNFLCGGPQHLRK